MKLLALALVSVLAIASKAQAGIFAEPYLGYDIGKIHIDTGPGGTVDGDATGVAIGGRVGGEFNMLFIGGDASTTFGGKEKDSTGNYDATKTDLYGVVGANLPLVRLWAGYGLLNQYTIKTSPSDDKISEGTHIKLGAGFKPFPLVALNVEYIMDDYKKLESGGSSVTLPVAGSFQSIKANTVRLSVSIPLSW